MYIFKYVYNKKLDSKCRLLMRVEFMNDILTIHFILTFLLKPHKKAKLLYVTYVNNFNAI